jgi:hypothetical protein
MPIHDNEAQTILNKKNSPGFPKELSLGSRHGFFSVP